MCLEDVSRRSQGWRRRKRRGVDYSSMRDSGSVIVWQGRRRRSIGIQVVRRLGKDRSKSLDLLMNIVSISINIISFSRRSVSRRRLIGIGCQRLTGIPSMSQFIVSLKSFPKGKGFRTGTTIVLRFVQVMGKVMVLCLPSMDVEFATILERAVILVCNVLSECTWIMLCDCCKVRKLLVLRLLITLLVSHPDNYCVSC